MVVPPGLPQPQGPGGGQRWPLPPFPSQLEDQSSSCLFAHVCLFSGCVFLFTFDQQPPFYLDSSSIAIISLYILAFYLPISELSVRFRTPHKAAPQALSVPIDSGQDPRLGKPPSDAHSSPSFNLLLTPGVPSFSSLPSLWSPATTRAQHQGLRASDTRGALPWAQTIVPLGSHGTGPDMQW